MLAQPVEKRNPVETPRHARITSRPATAKPPGVPCPPPACPPAHAIIHEASAPASEEECLPGSRQDEGGPRSSVEAKQAMDRRESRVASRDAPRSPVAAGGRQAHQLPLTPQHNGVKAMVLGHTYFEDMV